MGRWESPWAASGRYLPDRGPLKTLWAATGRVWGPPGSISRNWKTGRGFGAPGGEESQPFVAPGGEESQPFVDGSRHGPPRGDPLIVHIRIDFMHEFWALMMSCAVSRNSSIQSYFGKMRMNQDTVHPGTLSIRDKCSKIEADWNPERYCKSNKTLPFFFENH